jgi:hypothetical protein
VLFGNKAARQRRAAELSFDEAARWIDALKVEIALADSF